MSKKKEEKNIWKGRNSATVTFVVFRLNNKIRKKRILKKKQINKNIG